MLNENFSWKYNRVSGKYIIRNAKILFPNFEGAAGNYNAAGRRNFRIEISGDLAEELQQLGVYTRSREVDDRVEYTIKISVYPGAQIHMSDRSGDMVLPIDNKNPNNDSGKLLDEDFRLGRIINGEVNLIFYISKNTLVPTSSPYLRLSELYLKARRSELMDEYEQYLKQSMSDEEDTF